MIDQKHFLDYFSRLIEYLPDGAILTDLKATIITVNRPALRLLGYQTVEELIGKNALELLPPEELARSEANLSTLLEKKSVQNIERVIMKAGNQVKLEVSSALLPEPIAGKKSRSALTTRKQSQ